MFMLTWSTSRVISLLSRLSDYSHSTPTVLRDTLGYYSTHYQFIRTPFWYELHSGIEWYSWVLLHPLSVHPLVPRDILGYYSTHYHFIRTSFRYELRSELHLLLNRMSHYNSNGSYLNYLGTTGVTKVIHLYHCWYTICIQQLDNISDTMSVITWCQPRRFIEG